MKISENSLQSNSKRQKKPEYGHHSGFLAILVLLTQLFNWLLPTILAQFHYNRLK